MRRSLGWGLLVPLVVALAVLPGVGQDETPDDPYEPNDRVEDARSITLPFTSESARISPAGDRDVYAFEVAEPGSVIVDVDAEMIGSALDAMLVLMDADGRPVAMNDDDVGLDPRLDVDLDAGRYVVMVRSFDGVSTGAYQLRIASLGEPTCRAGTLTAGGSDRWRLGPFPAQSLVQLTLTGPPNSDFDIWVYEMISEQPVLTVVRERGVSLSSSESVSVQAGDQPTVYIVEVNAVEGSGDYELCAASVEESGSS